MREIKFRAWDNVLGLCAVESIDFAINCVYVRKDADKQFHTYTLSMENANLMQYTNIKDKNGKEIYEGDILSFLFFEDTKPRIEEVIWINENAGFGFPLGLCGLHDIEVIGNIYENPELLEDK